MSQQVHLDIVANLAGDQFFLGHGNVDLTDDLTINPRQTASLLHEIAWRIEDMAEDGALESPDAPKEPSPSVPVRKMRAYRDRSKLGLWYEVEPGKFVWSNDGRKNAEDNYSSLGAVAVVTEATLRRTYNNDLTEVDE